MTLSSLPSHPLESAELEQYSTEGEFAAVWLSKIFEAGDLTSETEVMDLGAGNGILGIGAALLGAKLCHLVEIDSEALEAAHQAVESLDLQGVCELIQSDVRDLEPRPVCLVITNPPWGFQTERADRPFLDYAFANATDAIHILHSAKATHIEAMAAESGWKGEIIHQGKFRLPAVYEHHTSRKRETAVNCWRFTR